MKSILDQASAIFLDPKNVIHPDAQPKIKALLEQIEALEGKDDRYGVIDPVVGDDGELRSVTLRRGHFENHASRFRQEVCATLQESFDAVYDQLSKKKQDTLRHSRTAFSVAIRHAEKLLISKANQEKLSVVRDVMRANIKEGMRQLMKCTERQVLMNSDLLPSLKHGSIG